MLKLKVFWWDSKCPNVNLREPKEGALGKGFGAFCGEVHGVGNGNIWVESQL